MLLMRGQLEDQRQIIRQINALANIRMRAGALYLETERPNTSFEINKNFKTSA